jgi:hypothetical protein
MNSAKHLKELQLRPDTPAQLEEPLKIVAAR